MTEGSKGKEGTFALGNEWVRTMGIVRGEEAEEIAEVFQELQKGKEDEEVGGGGEGKCLCWLGRVQDKWEGGLLLSPVADGAMNILYDLRLRRQPGCVAPRRCCHGRQTHRGHVGRRQDVQRRWVGIIMINDVIN